MKSFPSQSTSRNLGLALALVMTLTLGAGCSRAALTTAAQGPRDVGPLTAASFKGTKPAVVGVTFRDRQQLADLVAAGLEVWYVDQAAHKAFGQMTAGDLPAISRLRVDLREVQAPGIYNDFDKGYHSYDQIKSDLQELAAKNPEIASFSDIGDGWEKTQGKSDRDILLLHIGKGDGSKKPALLFCGNHHAREIVTPEIVLRLAHLLVDQYGKDADVTNFVENRDIYLVPMVNPDGHRLAAEGKDWRKNTNLTTGGGSDFGSGPNGPGVDLNRNYGFKWGGPGASTNPISATFRGPEAFSEPETRAIKALVETRKFTFLMTYHSFSNLILWPWGHTDQAPPDKRLPAVGMKLGKLSGYKPQQSVQLYPTSGDTTDWAFGQHNILAYTTEIGGWNDGFDPPYSKMGQFWKENEGGARLLLTLADNPAHVFGPELKAVTSRAGQVAAEGLGGAVEVELFTGKAGADGTGIKAPVDTKGKATIAAPARRGNGLALVHARDAAGQWGPLKAIFLR